MAGTRKEYVRGQSAPDTPAFAYMMRCEGGELYAGWTFKPAERLHAHKNGKGAKYTASHPAKGFAYLERCADKPTAMAREVALKQLTKQQKEELCAQWAEHTRPRITVATRKDAAEILEIYNWYVKYDLATFQITPSTLAEFEKSMEEATKVAPILLARDADGKLMGYACAHRWHEREAYRWSVESTVYCAPDARCLGVGDVLYRSLIPLLKRQGYWNIYALVSDPNPTSEHFHEKLGFTCVGRTPHTGYKLGRWLGLSFWWYPLRTGRSAPFQLQPLREDDVERCLGMVSWVNPGRVPPTPPEEDTLAENS